MTAASKPSKTTRVIFILTIIFAVMGIFVVLTGIIFPYLVSSKWFKTRIESHLYRSIGRQVRVERLEWRWQGELRLTGIQVPDTPEFSERPIAAISAAHINVSWRELIRNRVLAIDVALNGLTINLIRNRTGQINAAAMTSAGKTERSAVPKPDQADTERTRVWPFMDLKGQIRLAGLTLHMTDRIQDRIIVFKHGALNLAFPSIVAKPITLDASAQVEIDGQKDVSLNIDLTIDDFFHPKKWVDMDHLVLSLAAQIPGSDITLNADMKHRQIHGQLGADLAVTVPLIAPLLPLNFSDIEAAGTINLDLKAESNKQNRLVFKTQLTASNLFIDGSPVKHVPIRLNRIAMMHQGTYDPGKNRLRVTDGHFQISENRLNWHGVIDQSDPGSLGVQLTLENISFDIGEILILTERFMSPRLPYLRLEKRARPARFDADRMQLTGGLLSGPVDVNLENATLSISNAAVLEPDHGMPAAEVTHLKVSISKLATTLVDLFPSQLTLSGSVSADRFEYGIQQRMVMDRIHLSRFRLDVEEIIKTPAARFGMIGLFSVRTSLQTGQIAHPHGFRLDRIDQFLAIHGKVTPGGLDEIALENFNLGVKNLVASHPTLGSVQTTMNLKIAVPRIQSIRLNPLKISMANPDTALTFTHIIVNHPQAGKIDTSGRAAISAGQIALSLTDGFNIDARGARVKLNLPGLINLNMQADIGNKQTSPIRTTGQVTLYLAELSSILSFVSLGMTPMSGEAEITWQLNGRLPKRWPMHPITPTVFFSDTSIRSGLDRLDLTCRLKGVDVDGLIGEKFGIRLGRITTKTPLSYRFENTTGAGRFNGDVVADRITTLSSLFSGLPPNTPPLSIRLGVTGMHHGLEALRLSQHLSVDPLGVIETFESAFSGIATLFRSVDAGTILQRLSRLNGHANLQITVADGEQLQFLLPTFQIKGGANTTFGIRIQKEKTFDLSGRLETAGMDVSLKDTLDLKNLQVNIDFDKRYLIINRGDKAAAKTGYLSSRVIRKNPGPGPKTAPQDDPAPFLRSPWDHRMDGRQRLRFESARIQRPPFSFEMDHAAADLEIVDGFPHLKYFQAELLGGSVIGGMRIFEKEGRFLARIDVAFTGLDLKNLTVSGAPATDPADYRVGGRMSITFPLATRMQTQLVDLQLSLQFSHIGQRALGRLLFLMDPYETNETILSQRRILRQGTPKWIEIQVKDGILSLDGEVVVKGIQVKIPHLERLNVAEIAASDRFDAPLAWIQPIIDTLDMATRSTVILTPEKQK